MDAAKDAYFMEMAVVEASKSKNQFVDREDPKVGAVVVDTTGELVAAAYRGEPVGNEDPIKVAGDHAEFTAIIKKCAGRNLVGTTVYTTLEPCTTRQHKKQPCAEHLITAGVRRVVIGMVDPNPLISGRGIGRLREENIRVDLFSEEFAVQVEKQNQNFKKYQLGPQAKIISPPNSPQTVNGLTSMVIGRLDREVRKERIRCFVRKLITYWPQDQFRYTNSAGAPVTWECELHLHENIEYEFIIAKVSDEVELACGYYFLNWKSGVTPGFKLETLPAGIKVLARTTIVRTT